MYLGIEDYDYFIDQCITKAPNYEEFLFCFYCVIVIERTILILKDFNDNFKDGVTSVCHGIFSEVVRFLVYKNIHLSLYIFIHWHGIILFGHILPENLWTSLLCFLVVDFSYYWGHRLSHEINFLWAFHQVHHSSEQYNYTIAMRQSIVEYLYNIIFYIPAALFFPPSCIIFNIHIILFYQLFLHTELINGCQLLDWIFNMPNHHRVHHGSNKYCFNKNYGGILIIWDRIFDTFQSENGKIVYGLMSSPKYYNIFYQQIDGLLKLYEKIGSMKYYGDKMLTPLMGPRWHPGEPRLGLRTWKKNHRSKNKNNSFILEWNVVFIYVIAMTLLVLHSEFHMIEKTDRMIWPVGNMLLTFLICGLFFDHFSPVKLSIIESVRWFIILYYYPQDLLFVIESYRAIWYFYVLNFWVALLTGVRVAYKSKWKLNHPSYESINKSSTHL